jgi:hypothetical protein
MLSTAVIRHGSASLMAPPNPERAKMERTSCPELATRLRSKYYGTPTLLLHRANSFIRTNTTLVGRTGFVEQAPNVGSYEEVPPAKIDSSIDKWFFISGNSN